MAGWLLGLKGVRNISDQFWIAFFSTVGSIIVSIVTTVAAVVVLWLKIREASDKGTQNAEAIHEVKRLVNGKSDALRDKVDELHEKVAEANVKAAGLAMQKAGADAKLLAELAEKVRRLEQAAKKTDPP